MPHVHLTLSFNPLCLSHDLWEVLAYRSFTIVSVMLRWDSPTAVTFPRLRWIMTRKCLKRKETIEGKTMSAFSRLESTASGQGLEAVWKGRNESLGTGASDPPNMIGRSQGRGMACEAGLCLSCILPDSRVSQPACFLAGYRGQIQTRFP